MTPHDDSGQRVAPVDPIFVSVKETAALLRLSRWSVDKLLQAGTIESGWHGNRRLVFLDSVKAYARSLPTERDSEESA